MTLTPAFEIGAWNAWIFVLVFIAYLCVLMLIYRGIKTKSEHHGKPVKTYRYMILLVILLAVYSIFLPLLRGTGWFYAGSIVYLAGLVLIALAAADVDSAPEDGMFSGGIYRFSRHPMYFGYILVIIGTGIASASWLVMLGGVVYAVLSRFLMVQEENSCIERYGDSYQEYIKKTPRWIGLPKKENPETIDS
jgi:protein-S-isoprenylcysteine O-methyltransferase Ste14